VSGDCPLCASDGGVRIARTDRWRVVRAEEPGFPAFYRVVWNAHVAEFSDLSAAERAECMEAVVAVEQVLRRELSPTKVNLASLGNAVPHLHWHVIARFAWDSHFPGAVWAQAQREAPAARLRELAARLPELDAKVLRALPPAGHYSTDA
jgi:diadenosine tetraphosphate (Ap4A) HIT family hydrolase